MNKPMNSKINWTAAMIAAAGLAVAFGFVPKNAEAHLITLITVFMPTTIIIFRSWFTAK